jgi:hypothetical protein
MGSSTAEPEGVGGGIENSVKGNLLAIFGGDTLTASSEREAKP